MVTAIHVTHEAVRKLGGIGTVLHGLITSKKYKKFIPRTLLYTPLFHRDGDPLLRLGEDSEVLYSGLDEVDAGKWGNLFAAIEKKYGVRIIYGKKKFYHEGLNRDSASADIVAVDIWDMPPQIVDQFKYKLWESYRIQSDHFQQDRDYEQYLRIGVVLREIFEALYGIDERAVVFSHEYMGMSSALAFEMDKKEGRRRGDITIYYAHEVPTARLIAENHPGHDLTFYNIMNCDREAGTSLEEEFGSYSFYSRSELIKRASYLNYIFAVSDVTKQEFLYLCPNANSDMIKVVYNGIPIEKADFSEKSGSIDLIREYCEGLFNFRPDYIFTHVTRLVVSKALWRDIRFLYHLDEHFSRHHLKGFFLMLSTLIADGRPAEIIHRIENEYGWPAVHREGWPDLVGAEIDIYHYLELFNARSKSIKGVFLNQFGFGRERCGERVPESASLLGLRLASDIEFGLSIYEPFGIAQLETLPYGGVPVISSVCGSASLLRRHLKPHDYLSVDFTHVPAAYRGILKNKADFARITRELRDRIEMEICLETAPRLIGMLPRDDPGRRLRMKNMQRQCHIFDWDHVAERIITFLGLG